MVGWFVFLNLEKKCSTIISPYPHFLLGEQLPDTGLYFIIHACPFPNANSPPLVNQSAHSWWQPPTCLQAHKFFIIIFFYYLLSVYYYLFHWCIISVYLKFFFFFNSLCCTFHPHDLFHNWNPEPPTPLPLIFPIHPCPPPLWPPSACSLYSYARFCFFCSFVHLFFRIHV